MALTLPPTVRRQLSSALHQSARSVTKPATCANVVFIEVQQCKSFQMQCPPNMPACQILKVKQLLLCRNSLSSDGLSGLFPEASLTGFTTHFWHGVFIQGQSIQVACALPFACGLQTDKENAPSMVRTAVACKTASKSPPPPPRKAAPKALTPPPRKAPPAATPQDVAQGAPSAASQSSTQGASAAGAAEGAAWRRLCSELL